MENKRLNTLVVIPARGGSKGIPRKNLRPVAGRPLIYYSIQAALNARFQAKVIVSTEDEEIALLAERFGASVIMRDLNLSDDKTTLDPVIIDAVERLEDQIEEDRFEVIITVQPTSPLISPNDIEGVFNKLITEDLDTVITVVDDRHLCWNFDDEKPSPLYKKRVNRQKLSKTFKETGAVIACSRNQLSLGSRIGEKVGLYEVPQDRSFDIDTIADLYLCEAMLARKKIVFNVVGYPRVGLGHAYRAVMLANELVKFEIIFVCSKYSQIAIDYIKSKNYEVIISDSNEDAIVEAINNLKPNLIINDVLDTETSFMTKLKKSSSVIVNFEDMGEGSKKADLVINALYPNQIPEEKVLVGPDYFCLRDEFLYIGAHEKQKKIEIKKILLSFGGVDEGNITLKVLDAIKNLSIMNRLSIKIVTGPGYPHNIELEKFLESYKSINCSLIKKTNKISTLMLEADLAFTSGGRTVLELCSLNVPTVVICQNERETTHCFASKKNGIINLGHRDNVSSIEIEDTLKKLIADPELTLQMKKKMQRMDLKKGKSRVIGQITRLLS